MLYLASTLGYCAWPLFLAAILGFSACLINLVSVPDNYGFLAIALGLFAQLLCLSLRLAAVVNLCAWWFFLVSVPGCVAWRPYLAAVPGLCAWLLSLASVTGCVAWLLFLTAELRLCVLPAELGHYV
ncbi:hypothetical protein PoB_000034300 [Plakobranchus ocellatus]|uniref:NADH dehydrogenase subunit 6 n=1 Tax=Plakobranchus ocellatus TaxID=259542 RepID=A0AAV3XV23_9GAST|nr:hypothetical protein PoB_000034300 [Plakobranchus ocellatus]